MIINLMIYSKNDNSTTTNDNNTVLTRLTITRTTNNSSVLLEELRAQAAVELHLPASLLGVEARERA